MTAHPNDSNVIDFQAWKTERYPDDARAAAARSLRAISAWYASPDFPSNPPPDVAAKLAEDAAWRRCEEARKLMPARHRDPRDVVNDALRAVREEIAAAQAEELDDLERRVAQLCGKTTPESR